MVEYCRLRVWLVFGVDEREALAKPTQQGKHTTHELHGGTLESICVGSLVDAIISDKYCSNSNNSSVESEIEAYKYMRRSM